jgi:nicotinamidase-related amidase
MSKISKVLWDVDTQNDLILKGGEFAVPKAYLMVNKFEQAIKHFEKLEIPIMGVLDAHISRESVPGTRDEKLPLHCIKGTVGQQKIKQTQGDILYVSDHQYTPETLAAVEKEVLKGKRIYFEKQQQCQSSNPNIRPLFESLGVKEVYFIGLLTNVCIRFADKFFKSMGIKTYLVAGAVKGNDFPDQTEQSVIAEMLREGTEFYNIS